MKKNAPTPEQVDLFRLCVQEYANLLNLRDWRIEVGTKRAQRGAMADVDISLDDHLAVIRIGSDWGGKPVTNEDVRSAAVHEVLHVFLSRLIASCKSRDDTSIASNEHSVIVTLEKLLSQ